MSNIKRNANEILKEINSSAGKKLREMRDIRGLSRRELSEILCISQQQIEKYEKGKNRMSIGLIAFLAKEFDISINDFLHHDHYEHTKNIDYKEKIINSIQNTKNEELIILLNQIIKVFDSMK